MKDSSFSRYSTHGTGLFTREDLSRCGENVIFENNVRIFHPEQVEIGDNVYIGHDTILKGYHRNKLIIGDNSWIGQSCFFHSAGGITVGEGVGIGPGVRILTSQHSSKDPQIPIICSELSFGEVIIEDNCDIGIGSIILPGITIREGAIIGAGSVVTRDISGYAVWAGNPARFLRNRE